VNTMDPFTADRVVAFKQADLRREAELAALYATLGPESDVTGQRRGRVPRMKHLTRRYARLAVMTLGFAGLFVGANAIPGSATPPIGQTSVLLARGTDRSDGTLPIKEGLQVVVVQVSTPPGGSSGWHSHPGGGIIVVQQGEVTLYVSRDSQCVVTTYAAGQSFIERPGEVADAVNTGSIATLGYATFPGVPIGGSPRIDQSDPGICPGI
jgi:quercetin dioxygenase-like cupin family protein